LVDKNFQEMGLFKRSKNNNKPLIQQIISLIPNWMLVSTVARYKSDKGCSKYFTKDQLVSTLFGQMNRRGTLQDISTGIAVSETFIADLGLKQSPSRSTMSDGNKKRDWRVFETLYSLLFSHYSVIMKGKNRLRDIEEIKGKSIKIIDSTLISLCLSLFDWAKYWTAKGGIKIHTCWDEVIMLPELVNITEAKVAGRKGLANLSFNKGTIIIEDKGYYDFSLMLSRIQAENVFVTRIKNNACFEVVRIIENTNSDFTGLVGDQIIRLTGKAAVECGIDQHLLRLVHVYHEEEDTVLEILTNQLDWDAYTISQLYKARWDIETFFKTLKQNLQVQSFIGTSENAVKSQIYIALIAYLLLELIRRTICKTSQGFSNFCEKIRICLTYYQTLDYVCNTIRQGAHRIRDASKGQLDIFRQKQDLFSGQLSKM